MVLLLILTLAGAALRFNHAEDRQFWGDEVRTYQVANETSTLAELWQLWAYGNRVADPPLFYLLSYLNTHGAETYNHVRIRLISLLFGILAIPLAYRVFRRFDESPVALTGAGILALSAFAIQYSQEYRVYSMLLCATLLFADSLVLFVERFSWKRWSYLLGSSALLIYTHFFGGFVLAGGYLLLLAVAFRRRNQPSDKLPWLPVFLIPVVLTVLYIPMIYQGIMLARFHSLETGKTTNAEINKAHYESFKANFTYTGHLLESFASWRLGNLPKWAWYFSCALLFAGIARLALVRRSVLIWLTLWTGFTFGVSVGFYEFFKYPFDPRRNIIHLPVFVYLMAQGVWLPFELARHFTAHRGPRYAGALATGLLLGAVILLSLRNYDVYRAHGWRNEKNQADWRGMAQFISKMARPGDKINVVTVPDTWQRLHYMFYHQQYARELPVSNLNDRSSVQQQLTGAAPMWFIISQYHVIPKDLFELLVTSGQWFNFYGGSIVFLPPGAGSPDPNLRRQIFAVARPGTFAIAAGRGTAVADMLLTGPLAAKMRLDKSFPYAKLHLPEGVHECALTFDKSAQETTLSLFRELEPGTWVPALDFSQIQPSSTRIDMPILNGSPVLYLQHNGLVKYRFWLEEEGDYLFRLEAKHDRPGPIIIRVFFSQAGELPRIEFDRQDNSFGEKQERVHLKRGLNELTLYYPSFKRIEDKTLEYEDQFNVFHVVRWRLDRLSANEQTERGSGG